MDIQAWNEGTECDSHEMSWCAYCNPNETSLDRAADRPKPGSLTEDQALPS